MAPTTSKAALLLSPARNDSSCRDYRSCVSRLAGWALWLRIAQYGWSPERLYGVLITIVALVWTVGFCLSVLFTVGIHKGLCSYHSGYRITGADLPVLVYTPVLDPRRISVESHMARYQDGRINADRKPVYAQQYRTKGARGDANAAK